MKKTLLSLLLFAHSTQIFATTMPKWEIQFSDNVSSSKHDCLIGSLAKYDAYDLDTKRTYRGSFISINVNKKDYDSKELSEEVKLTDANDVRSNFNKDIFNEIVFGKENLKMNVLEVRNGDEPNYQITALNKKEVREITISSLRPNKYGHWTYVRLASAKNEILKLEMIVQKENFLGMRKEIMRETCTSFQRTK